MAVDLTRLIQVRERRRLAAQQAVVQQQRATEAQQAAVWSAQAEWQRQVTAQAELWHDAGGGASSSAGLSVSALRDLSAWSGSLNGGIQRAADAVQDSEQVLAVECANLDERRAQLRQAAGALSKAETLHERVSRDLRRAAEWRLDDAADEAATQGWQAPAFRANTR